MCLMHFVMYAISHSLFKYNQIKLHSVYLHGTLHYLKQFWFAEGLTGVRIGLDYLYRNYRGQYQELFQVNKEGETTAKSIICEKGNTTKSNVTYIRFDVSAQ